MTGEERRERFRIWRERLASYELALSVMGLDAGAGAPPEGKTYRGEKRAVLQGEYRRVWQEAGMEEIAARIAEDPEEDPDLRREAELAAVRLRRERQVPVEDYVELERLLAVSRRYWLRAKAEGDFPGYAPHLQAVVEQYRKITDRQEGEGSLYDKMLDSHQPGWNRERYDAFFGSLKKRLLPLLAEIQEAEPVPDSFLHESYPVQGQRRVMKKLLPYLGVTEDWARMSESEHPLTTFLSRGDVRFTTKYRERDIAQAVFSTVHESGHAWFAHNVEEKYDGTLIGRTISAGLHESQSRLCENHLARSIPFWERNLPLFQEEFPRQLAGVSPEEFYRAANAVKPSLVRTEADEVTYPLHIMIRYELEKEMMEGGLKVLDLEEAWNEKYREYLGLAPGSAAEGVLQDMHWPYAYFGYFPTYALGSAMAAQVYAAMEKELDVPLLLKTDRYPEIMLWLREKLHRYGNRCPAKELIRKCTGEPFSEKWYLDWLEKKYRELYRLHKGGNMV